MHSDFFPPVPIYIEDQCASLVLHPALSGLNNFYFTNEIVFIRACCVVPSVSCVLIKQHTMHGRSSVWFLRGPAVVRDLLQVVLGSPHPSLIACYVVARCPPAFRLFKIYKSSQSKKTV